MAQADTLAMSFGTFATSATRQTVNTASSACSRMLALNVAIGRKPSPVLKYLDIMTTPDGMKLQVCKACGCQKKSKALQATQWAMHIVCGGCPDIALDVRIHVGKQCKQDDVVAALPSLY